MLTVPDAYTAAVVRSGGMAGRRWVDDLPDLVDQLCIHWSLTLDGAPLHGHLGLVVPVRHGDDARVLKVSWADATSIAQEALALSVWDGQGAVRLVAAWPERGALLLERLDSRRSLQALDLDQSVPVVGHLLRRLAVPAPPGFPLLSGVARRLADEMPARWARLGRPFPQALLDRTHDLALELGPAAGDRLVHWDLHGGNVLAGAREPWLAIDPMVVTGDPEYGVAPLLLRGLDRMDGRAELRRHLSTLIHSAGLDPVRARSWAIVRLVDYWLWALSIGLTEDPKRCETVVEWLR